MKKMIISAMLLGATVMAKSQNATLVANHSTHAAPTVKWEKTTIDLGKIKLNLPAIAQFTFRNVGGGALILTEVKPSCSCTVSEFTKDPIQSGQKGMVKAQYNANKVGKFYKTLSVLSNSEGGMEVLTIQGEVVE